MRVLTLPNFNKPCCKRICSCLSLLTVLTSLSAAQTVTFIDNFSLTSSMADPAGTLAQGRDGNLYGGGGACCIGAGEIYKTDTSGVISVLHTFDGADGGAPSGGTILGTDGNFYGTTFGGGTNNSGVLFKITPTADSSVLYDFFNPPNAGGIWAAPIEGTDGNLYGADNTSWTSVGLYKYTSSGTFTTIYQADYPLANNGTAVYSRLLQAADGNLYVTLFYGGTKSCGAILKVSTSGTLLHAYNFNCGYLGALPVGPLIQASDGNFYGTTNQGGTKSTYGFGTIFKMSQAGVVTVLYRFTGGTADGKYPWGTLVQGTDGYLYGVTQNGGAFLGGTIFRISTSGQFTLLYSFPQAFAGSAYGGLVQHTNGLFYGTTQWGGEGRYGTIYSFDMGLGSFVTFVRPAGKVGQTAEILGQGLIGATSVTFNGVPAASYSVVSDTYLTAVVPNGVTTGPVVVTTAAGTLTSNVNFRISK
jgi:uncharacterized repeat protein (TIGR03803 family)